jgi:thiol-disulfide isomerase/thioredoxin
MKKFIKEALVLFLTLFIVSNAISLYRANSIDATSNYQKLLDQVSIDGQKISTIIKPNKPLIINFWGSWCPVCKQEISTIEKISKDSDVILVTIAVNSGDNQILKDFLKSKKINFLVINDKDGKIAKSFNISVFPTTIFYSPNKKKIIKDSGYLSYGGYLARKKLVE